MWLELGFVLAMYNIWIRFGQWWQDLITAHDDDIPLYISIKLDSHMVSSYLSVSDYSILQNKCNIVVKWILFGHRDVENGAYSALFRVVISNNWIEFLVNYQSTPSSAEFPVRSPRFTDILLFSCLFIFLSKNKVQNHCGWWANICGSRSSSVCSPTLPILPRLHVVEMFCGPSH